MTSAHLTIETPLVPYLPRNRVLVGRVMVRDKPGEIAQSSLLIVTSLGEYFDPFPVSLISPRPLFLRLLLSVQESNVCPSAIPATKRKVLSQE
jgi:hypothetical protein